MVDIATQDRKLVARLKEAKGGRFADEPLGRELFESVHKGKTELDSVSDVEDHGHSRERGIGLVMARSGKVRSGWPGLRSGMGDSHTCHTEGGG